MLIGREQELRTLNDAVAQVVTGNGRTFFISGEAGLGKTTLVLEWQKSLPGSCVFLSAACAPPLAGAGKGKLEALQPWREILTDLREKVGSFLNIEELFLQYAPSWAAPSQKISGERDPNAANQSQIFRQFVNLIEKIAEHIPLVLFIDDAEWIDESSSELLQTLGEHIGKLRVLVIVADGSEDADAVWGVVPHGVTAKDDLIVSGAAQDVPLKRWDAADIRALLSALFTGYNPAGAAEAWLANVSGGNPFYLANYITTLRDDSLINANGAFLGNRGDLHPPLSAKAAAQQRVRRLNANAQYILGYAAVEAGEFDAAVLGRINDASREDIVNGLAEARQRGIIAQAGTKADAFRFSHALFRQALYDGLSDPEKESVHREHFAMLTAEWENAAEPERQIAIASDLLFHAEKCGEYIFGAMVALATARSLWKMFAEKEALEALNKLIGYGDVLKETDPDFHENTFRKEYLLPALILHAKIDDTRARYDRALELYERAETLADELNDGDKKIDAMNGRGNVFMHRAQYRELLKIAEANKNLAQQAAYDNGIASATNLLGIAHSETGDQQKALECFRVVLAIGEKNNDHAWQMRALGHIGNVHQALGEFSAALQSFDTVLALAAEHQAPIMRATYLHRKATVYESLGEYENALKCFEESLEIAIMIGDRLSQAIALLKAGNMKANFYDYEGALHVLNEGYDISREIGNRRLEQTIISEIGIVYQFKGDFNEALAWHQKAYRLAVELEFKEAMAFAMANLGYAYKYMERYQNAEVYLEGAVKILKDILNNHAGFALALRETADLYGYKKEYDKALQHLDEARKISERMGYKLELAEIFLVMGRIYRNIQALDTSKEYLKKASAIAKEYNRLDIDARVKGEMGLVKEAEGDRDGALQLLHESIEACKTVAPFACAHLEKELKQIMRTKVKQST